MKNTVAKNINFNTEGMSEKAKILTLALLAHQITVCARGHTYEAGTEKVLEPELLRRYNELQHQITGSIRDHITGRGGMPLQTVLEMTKDFGKEIARENDIDWALSFVHDQITRHPEWT